MLKTSYIILISFTVFFANAQKDSLRKKSEWLSYFAGIDVGYTGYDHISGYNAETNLNYVFNPQYFCIKVQLGIAPGTNFGTLKKAFIGMGFITKTSKLLSWHLITGFGTVKPSRSYSVTEYNNYNYVRTYEFYCSTFYIETGFYLRPLKDKRLILGLNTMIHRSSIVDTKVAGIYQTTHNAMTTNINFSINFKLNK